MTALLRSFQDSDGDGTGDLKGIESRIDYLAEIGVEAVWISPFFTSPMIDFGYDISNFTAVDPIFGTMDDFKSLLNLGTIYNDVGNFPDFLHPLPHVGSFLILSVGIFD